MILNDKVYKPQLPINNMKNKIRFKRRGIKVGNKRYLSFTHKEELDIIYNFLKNKYPDILVEISKDMFVALDKKMRECERDGFEIEDNNK